MADKTPQESKTVSRSHRETTNLKSFAELEKANDLESLKLIQLLLEMSPQDLAGIDPEDLEAIQDLELHEAEGELPEEGAEETSPEISGDAEIEKESK